jgi:hypothetical protein
MATACLNDICGAHTSYSERKQFPELSTENFSIIDISLGNHVLYFKEIVSRD